MTGAIEPPIYDHLYLSIYQIPIVGASKYQLVSDARTPLFSTIGSFPPTPSSRLTIDPIKCKFPSQSTTLTQSTTLARNKVKICIFIAQFSQLCLQKLNLHAAMLHA